MTLAGRTHLLPNYILAAYMALRHLTSPKHEDRSCP